MSNTEQPLHIRVATRKLNDILANRVASRVKTAGEIRFVKDQGPKQREIPEDFVFKTKYLKPMSRVLWSLSCSMGHLVSAHSIFTKMKAVNMSPDGNLGGKGYIQEIREMRKKLSESIETLSDCIDTVHDEIKAPHWQHEMKHMPKEDEQEVNDLVQEAEEVMEDPESYADKDYETDILSKQ